MTFALVIFLLGGVLTFFAAVEGVDACIAWGIGLMLCGGGLVAVEAWSAAGAAL